MRKIRFLPECDIDTTLITFFVKNAAPIDHEPCIGDVANAMKNVKDKEFVLVGLIDNDKRKPKYFDDFEEISSNNDIIFKKKPQVEHYLLILDKASEKFILKNAQAVGINLEDYGFPSDLKSLTKLTKKENIKTNQNFQNLLQDLKNKSATGFLEIEKILKKFL
jgi:hypothetical protein